MNKPERYGSSVILDKYLLYKEPDYAKFMEERLWDNFKDLIIRKLKEDDSIIVEKVFDMQKDLFETNQRQVRQDISIKKLIHCKDCGHNCEPLDSDVVWCESFPMGCQMNDPNGYCYKAIPRKEDEEFFKE